MSSSIFVTGGEGFLGRHLIPFLKGRRYRVNCPTHSKFDITNICNKSIQEIRDQSDIVINLAAYTNVNKAEQEYSQAKHINADSLDWLNNLGDNIQVYHISTDYVYDSTVCNSKETDLLLPVGAYGRSKAEGDTRLLSFCNPNIHIIRTSFKPIKWQYSGAFTNVITNADTVDIISKMICHFILACPPGGVYNLGTESKTVYELAKRNNPEVKPILKNYGLLIDHTMSLTKISNYS